MESLYSSLIMFSGATITLLGVCLVISERQLRKKQRELNEYKRKHGANPTKSSTASEHPETSSSSGRLDEYKTKPSELLSVQSDHKRLEETIASQKNEFQKSEAEREHDRQGDERRDEGVERERGDERQNEEGGENDEVAVGEVDEAHHAEDQG